MLYTIDILFVAFVLFFVVGGVRHGFSGELAHVITLLALLVGICFYYPRLVELASDYWRVLPEPAVRILVPVVLVLAAVLLFVVVRALLTRLLKDKAGGPVDKVGGGLVGALRGILLGFAVFAGISLIPNETLYRAISEKSSIGTWVCNTLTPWAQSHVEELPVLKDKAQKQLDDLTQ